MFKFMSQINKMPQLNSIDSKYSVNWFSEFDAEQSKCHGFQFQCFDGKCIDLRNLCNGIRVSSRLNYGTSSKWAIIAIIFI